MLPFTTSLWRGVIDRNSRSAATSSHAPHRNDEWYTIKPECLTASDLSREFVWMCLGCDPRAATLRDFPSSFREQ